MKSLSIRLNKKNNRIVIKHTSPTIRLGLTRHSIKLRHSGVRGPAGPKGDTGYGIPAGGAAEQVLRKGSNADYDFEWTTFTEADKTYAQEFTVSDFVTVQHNLGKYPAVSVIDSAGDEIEGTVEHANINLLTISFTAPFSGRVVCN